MTNHQSEIANKKISDLEAQLKSFRDENILLKEQINNQKVINVNNEAFCKELEFELENVRGSEKKLQKLLELSYDAVLFIGAEKEIIDCNQACVNMFEFADKKELIGKSFLEITAPEFTEKSKEKLNHILTEGEKIKYEKSYVTKSGKKFPAIISASLIDKKTKIIAVVIQDVTELKEQEEIQKSRIDHLTKASIINKVISKVRTIEELKRSLCRHVFSLSTANEVWLIDDGLRGAVNLYHGYSKDEESSFYISESSIGKDDKKSYLKELEFYSDGNYALSGSEVLFFPFFEHQLKLYNQHILVIKLNDSTSITIGLNYFQETNEYNNDGVFLRNLRLQIILALNSLINFEKLIENEAKFRALTEKLDDVIIVRNIKGEYTYASPSVKLYGYKPNEIVGKTASDFIHASERPKVLKALSTIIGTRGTSVVIPNLRIHLKNGTEANAYCTLTNLLHQKGVKGIVVNLRDITETLIIEKQLKESEKKYRALFENANDGILLLKDKRISICNEKLSELFRDHEREIIGKSPVDISPEFQPNGMSSKELAENHLNEAIEGGKVFFEWKHKRFDGSEFDAHVSLSYINFLEEDFILAIVRDISSMKKITEQLRENEARLSNIFESMTDGVYLSSGNCEIEYMNKAMKDQTGVEFYGKSCFSSIYGFESPCDWCKNNLLKKGEKYLVDIYNPKSKRYYQVSKTKITNSKGEDSVLHISRDVTEVKMAETHIRQSEEKFRNIFNHSNDAIYITDFSGNFLEVNKQALIRINTSRAELLNKNFLSFSQMFGADRITKYLQNIIENYHATEQVSYINHKGFEVFSEISGTQIDYLGEKCILHVSRDITARKEMERRILETTIQTEENERSRFAQDLHDGIGPYLSATKFFLKTITKEEQPQHREEIVNKAIDAIDEIIGNIKEISNNISPHVLRNFGLISAINSFKKKLGNDLVSIDLKSNIEGQRFNENIEISIFRIIIELINNTLKYAQANYINVSLFIKKDELLVTFLDDGKGFDVEKAKEGKGNGIYNIINRVSSLGGKCKFSSDNGNGFVFSATFNVNK